jgi:hypothetical protein
VAIAVVLLLLVGLAVIAPSLPAGNPIRDLGEALRDLGRGFGGGYGELPSG